MCEVAWWWRDVFCSKYVSNYFQKTGFVVKSCFLYTKLVCRNDWIKPGYVTTRSTYVWGEKIEDRLQNNDRVTTVGADKCRRILISSNFGNIEEDFRKSIAEMAKILCQERSANCLVAFLACRMQINPTWQAVSC